MPMMGILATTMLSLIFVVDTVQAPQPETPEPPRRQTQEPRERTQEEINSLSEDLMSFIEREAGKPCGSRWLPKVAGEVVALVTNDREKRACSCQADAPETEGLMLQVLQLLKERCTVGE